MPKIAISYRRTDSDATGRIFDRLILRYGIEAVFRDIDNIPFGIDFRKAVNTALLGTNILIAVVGPNWRGSGKRGSAKINDENDLVRIEVEIALKKDIPVIPVLIGGATMPKPTELPDSLHDFSFRNAANIDSGRNFNTDIDRLMRSIDHLLEDQRLQVELTVATPTSLIEEKVVDSAPNSIDEKPLEDEPRDDQSALEAKRDPLIETDSTGLNPEHVSPGPVDTLTPELDGLFCAFALRSPGLVGLNNLARCLNDLRGRGLIRDWHVQGWKDNTKLKAIIRFDTNADALAAAITLQRT